MIYNLALVFDEDFHNEIFDFAQRLQIENDCEFEYTLTSVPHATLIKYESEENPFKDIEGQYTITISGLTLLPSRNDEDSGTWIELSVLIPDELRSKIASLVTDLDQDKLRSEIGDILRPHITICKFSNQDSSKIPSLNPSLLRKSEVVAKLHAGSAGKGFSFSKS